MTNSDQIEEAWDRLVKGEPFPSSWPRTIEGRLDLRGLLSAKPVPQTIKGRKVSDYIPHTQFKGSQWMNMDFTGSKFSGLRLMGCRVENCVFDNCQFDDQRTWATAFLNSRFLKASLKDCMMGAPLDGVRTSYTGVDFSGADLTRTNYSAVAFENCYFRAGKLKSINFDSSTFENCVFEGELYDVQFFQHGFRGEHFPPNEMVNVDFRKAKLRFVEFRDLLLDKVQLPNDSEQLLLRNYAEALNRTIDEMKRSPNELTDKVVGIIEVLVGFYVPNQLLGVVNLNDIKQYTGQGGVDLFLATVPKENVVPRE